MAVVSHMTDLQNAIDENNILKIKQALKNNQNPNDPIDECENALFYACSQKASFEVMKLLIESGVDIKTVTQEGIGVLDEAIILDDLEFVEYLLKEQKIDPNETKRRSKFTPIMQAASYGFVEIAKLLLKYGANIEHKDNLQLTAIDYAKKLQQKNMEIFLQEYKV